MQFPTLFPRLQEITPWNSYLVDKLAEKDYILPPTGRELKSVLKRINDISLLDGDEAEVIRWD